MQRRITKRLPGLATLSYSERLKYLCVPSLELRRFHTDLCWRYDLQIMFGLVRVDLGDSLVFSTCRPTRRHKYKLLKHLPLLHMFVINFLPSV